MRRWRTGKSLQCSKFQKESILEKMLELLPKIKFKNSIQFSGIMWFSHKKFYRKGTDFRYFCLENTASSFGSYSTAAVAKLRKALSRGCAVMRHDAASFEKKALFSGNYKRSMQKSCDAGCRRYSWRINLRTGEKDVGLKGKLKAFK